FQLPVYVAYGLTLFFLNVINLGCATLYIITSLSYHVVLEKMAWYDAQQYCREIYTDLVSIKDQEQNEEVKLKGKNSIMSFWIGLLCDVWEWADGGLSGYRNWGGDNSHTFLKFKYALQAYQHLTHTSGNQFLHSILSIRNHSPRGYCIGCRGRGGG
uniref:C-type lectin domain-containing protein n=1 Tax=Electrophorus electricus TaxID=8005 RepID=A0AAY5F2M3_ELEEL